MLLKITVKTPKGQAAQCMKTQRDALLGFKKSKNVKEEKLINDNSFYWIVPYETDNELFKMNKRLLRGEAMIKSFYRTLIKTLDRANKLASKFNKGASWIKRWIIKKLKKQNQDDLVQQVEMMTDEQIIDFIKINDRKEMMELLAGSLIDTEILE